MAGIQEYVKKQQREKRVGQMARTAGLDVENLRKALKTSSKKGLSYFQAQRIAPLFGVKGAKFYIESQAAVMKARITAGDGKQAALQGLANPVRRRNLPAPEREKQTTLRRAAVWLKCTRKPRD